MLVMVPSLLQHYPLPSCRRLHQTSTKRQDYHTEQSHIAKYRSRTVVTIGIDGEGAIFGFTLVFVDTVFIVAHPAIFERGMLLRLGVLDPIIFYRK